MRAAIKRGWGRTPARHQPATAWQNPPPSGPVVFDPALRTAAELMANARQQAASAPPKAA